MASWAPMQMTLTPVAGSKVRGSGVFALGAGSRLPGSACASSGRPWGLFGLGSRLRLAGLRLTAVLAAAPAAAPGLRLGIVLGPGFARLRCVPGPGRRYVLDLVGPTPRLRVAALSYLTTPPVRHLDPRAEQIATLRPQSIAHERPELPRPSELPRELVGCNPPLVRQLG